MFNSGHLHVAASVFDTGMPLGSTWALPGLNGIGFDAETAFQLFIQILPLKSASQGGLDLTA